MTADDPRVLVTGLGPVTSIGVGSEDFHAGQLKGVSGVRRISRFDAADLPVRIAGEVDLPAELTLTGREAATADRTAQLALAAAKLALEDSGLDLSAEDRARIGVVLGTGAGGTNSWESNAATAHSRGIGRLAARFIPMSMANGSASRVSVDLGILGPSSTVVTACASGAEALITAAQMITSGEADVVLAGGADAPVTPMMVGGFAKIRALSTRNDEPERASRPFAADRDGFVLAEGAAVLVLESAAHATARGARVLAELRGYGRSSDAHHVTAPHPEGAGAARAIEAALRSARLRPEDISYVNAHGTGTTYNDAAEAKALRTALGEYARRTPVTAPKSMTGHALGAAGAIEAVATVQSLDTGVVPPTVNLTEPDQDLGLDVVGAVPRDLPVDAVLSNSFAFGGHNVVLAFTRPPEAA
ncbi:MULTISPECIES: beta-ketoacyl-ACP synthase II [unclassified Streptomyces]|uniref:beta-ketoacyl-ACP synthase II n=1 Tax=unclassified Streptomyces TaxID=2593676 RepID=UPI00278C23C6|nr:MULTISPECIES: beta-ketoacyl-ACP synthase II [unclassified Streptomyces]